MQHEGYIGLENLNNEFEIVFFESLYTVEIPDATLLALTNANINYNFEWVDRTQVGKNSMDFCLIAYLALRSSLVKEPENYFILSKDRDFNIPSSYISSKVGIQIKTINNINQFINNREFNYKELTPETIINTCIEQAASLHELHNLLQKTLKQFYTPNEITYLYKGIITDNKIK